MAVPDDVPPELLSRAVKSCYENSKGPLSRRDNDPFKVGAIGHQPQLFIVRARFGSGDQRGDGFAPVQLQRIASPCRPAITVDVSLFRQQEIKEGHAPVFAGLVDRLLQLR